MDERLEAWMKAKHAKTIWANLMSRVVRANDRGAKRVTVPTELLEEMLNLYKEIKDK